MLGKKGYPTIDVKRTGLNLKRICQERKLSVLELQRYLGLACPQTIYRWFSGQAIPSLDHLFALSSLLKLPMEKLLVKEQLFGENLIIVKMNEQEIIINWLFFMRLKSYYGKRQTIPQNKKE